MKKPNGSSPGERERPANLISSWDVDTVKNKNGNRRHWLFRQNIRLCSYMILKTTCLSCESPTLCFTQQNEDTQAHFAGTFDVDLGHTRTEPGKLQRVCPMRVSQPGSRLSVNQDAALGSGLGGGWGRGGVPGIQTRRRILSYSVDLHVSLGKKPTRRKGAPSAV